MTAPLYALGRIAARHWWLFIPIWVVLTVAIVLVANSVGRPTNNNLVLPGTGSTRAANVLAKGLPDYQNGSVPIVLESTDGRLDSGSNAQAINKTVDELSKDQYVNVVVSPLSVEGSSAITSDGKIAFISVFLNLSSGDLSDDEANQVFSRTKPASDAGIEVSAGGYLGSQLSIPSTSQSDRLGVLVAILVLLIALGTVTAMAMPITTALFALLTGLSLIGFLGHIADVPQVAPTLGTMLGLAVGIDYSLFIISRHQRQVRSGMEPIESAGRAIASAGGAVVFAGSTVIVAVLCLYFSGIDFVRVLGYSAALVVAVAMTAALTLLPAIMGLLGRRIEALSVPWFKGPQPEEPQTSAFARRAERIGRRPLLYGLFNVALLVVLAIPVFQMQLGSIDFGQYPKDTTMRQAYDTLTRGFGVGYNAPLLVAVEFPKNDPAQTDPDAVTQVQQQAAQQQQEQQQAIASGQEQAPSQAQQQQQQEQLQYREQVAATPASDTRLVSLQSDISKTKDVTAVTPATVSQNGETAAFTAIPNSGSSAEATRNLVKKLRNEVIPKSDSSTGLKSWVGGNTASFIDLATKIGDKLVLVILIVVVLGFLLLMFAFRAVVIPLLAALLNLLAVVAAYGVLTAVFELGWGVKLIGLESDLPVVSFVPLMMFAILFGLSMDYQVFLLSRSKEAWDASKDPHHAVVGGLRLASRVVIAAATVMFAVFASFIINGDPTVKQFGVGLAVAVAIDAWIVTTVMPAMMLLFGKHAWYLPRWLDKILPDVGIEGEPYFRKLDAERAAAAGTGGGAAAEADATPPPGGAA